MFKIENLKKIDTRLFLLTLVICLIGAMTVFSTTYFPDKVASSLFLNQILFYIVGFMIYFILSTINYKVLNNKFITLGVFLTTIITLVLVLSIGETIFNAKRWITIGPFTLQPSELTKISIILITSFSLTVREKITFEKIFNIYEIKKDKGQNIKMLIHSDQFIKFLLSIFSLIIFIVLIMLQKSLGNSILITLIYSIIIFMSLSINAKFISVLISIILGIVLSFNLIYLPQIDINFANINPIGVVLAILIIFLISKSVKIKHWVLLLIFIPFLFIRPALEYGYNNVIETYQRKRIETFLNPDPSIELTADYNRRQAINAIGSGQVLGKGFLNGNIVKLQLLPFAFTDFAYAAYAEQFGFIGTVFLLIIYLLLITRIVFIGKNSTSDFGRYISYGVAAMIFLNTAQHVGMNLGMLPITGVPLPLISSGGSAILTIFIGLGLVQSIVIRDEEDQEEVTDFKYDFGFSGNFNSKSPNSFK